MVPDGVHAAAVAALMSHRLQSSWQRRQALRLPSCLQGVTRLCCATRTPGGTGERPRSTLVAVPRQ